ncbi:MAG: glycan-binding surface protein [Bacteroides sp.]|nr:glycan-binding surface protein [Bacteroides sp.]
MKTTKYIWLLCMFLLPTVLTSCNDSDDYFSDDAQSTPISVTQIYLEDYESSVPDRAVTFARLGQLIRIEGSGLYGMRAVYINGYDTYFNRAYVTDNSMLITINSNTPVADAEEEDRNIIRLVKDNTELSYSFTIRAASPTVTSVSNTLPKAGETVIVYGTGLEETTKVTLPGGTEITTGIESDEDGAWYSFTMPSGITESGSIYSEGANGQAATPAYFNFDECMILDFDGNGTQGYWSWSETGSMINADDLVDDPVAGSDRGKCVQIIPERLITAGGVMSGKPRASECWTAGNDNEADDWSLMYSYIPAETSLTEVALQFDVYVSEDDPWTGCGQIQICLFNNFNFAGIGSDDDGSSNQVAFYVPYIQSGEIIPFYTEGWQTVTIPFSEFNKYATLIADSESPTFADVVTDRNAATYRNFGMGFANTDFTYDGVSVTSSTFTTRIYLDNWRVVPCKSITISDYPEDEEE